MAKILRVIVMSQYNFSNQLELNMLSFILIEPAYQLLKEILYHWTER
jgi:hypothetical protein